MATALRPTTGNQLAPPAVGCAAYLSATTGTRDIIAHAMLGYAILQALFLARLFPWIRQLSFTPSYWGITFGVTAAVIASIRMLERGDLGVIIALAPMLFVLANSLLFAVTLGTMVLIWKGTLLPVPAR